VVAV
ncbi:translation elongation factor G, partial [Vibrio parahaemolyticus VPTS-2010]